MPLRTGLLAVLVFASPLRAEEPKADLRADATKALKTAATFYRTKVASRGGYVYYYTPDLKQRWGEGVANEDTIFVQPPGTPTVGMAYLKAFEATGEKFYADAARETAEALVYGQLESGGWTQTIIRPGEPPAGSPEPPPAFGKANRVGKYRNGKGGNWNVSSLDDGQTQAALVMLMRADRAIDFKHKEIHEAVAYGLDRLLAAQFRSGGFPQVWQKAAEDFRAVPAKYPDYDWKTEGRVKNYWDFPTLNDGLAGTVAEVLIEAHQTYKDAKYKDALAKLGDFLVLAQMPDPQPGWCQQYSREMVPIWARKFEPAAITGWESQDAMRTLIKIARYTGEKKYLEPIPKALAYFNKSLLPDGRVPRFYELKTNKPLYMNARYELTYDDSATPDHYGWKQSAHFKEIEKEYEDAKAGRAPKAARGLAAKELEADVRRIVNALDAEGRWVSTYGGERLVGQPKFAPGFKFVSSAVFSTNMEALGAYLVAK
jgi:PelA/Pel-15E family pectate lyase